MKPKLENIGIEPFMETNVIENAEAFQQWITGGAKESFLIKIDSDFGEDYDILRGDWVVIDRNREPKKNDVVVNFAPGGFVVVNYHLGLQLVEKLSPDSLIQQQNFLGVIVAVIRKMVD